ncbi:MAG: PAS domain-containing protein [Myxococcaceae bacterium]|nr:PAS domain-containing protein [Myxococcaceae bacterium]
MATAKTSDRIVDFQRFFEATPGLYLVLRADFTIVAVNDAYLKATMTVRDDIVGRGVFDVFRDEPAGGFAAGASDLRASLMRVVETGKPDTMAVQKHGVRRPDGQFEERYWSPRNAPVCGADGAVLYIIHGVEDVTEFVKLREHGTELRKSSEELRTKAGQMDAEIYGRAQELQHTNRHLREVSSLLEAIIEHIPDMIFLKDARTLSFERMNRAGEELLGVPRSAMLGKSDYDFFPREEAEFFQKKDRETLDSDKLVVIAEEEIQTATGKRWLHTKKIPLHGADGKPSHLLGISSDITARKQTEAELQSARENLERRVEERTSELRREIDERKRAEELLRKSEEQLLHSQKMEAVGRLAGGIAHDFNNLLAVIISYSDIVLGDVKVGDPLREDIEEIRRAGERAANLTRQLLAFSRQQVLEPRVLDLNEVVTGMEKMLQRLIGEDIHVRTVLSDKLHKVLVDPGQMEQVLMNLVVNSRDAMPHGGKLTIETANFELDAAYARQHLGVEPGPYVMLAITDSGQGMDKETQARIFEPFFTTKEKGKGTGLGLSTVFGIIRQSMGCVYVSSDPGIGTTMKVYLPKAETPEVSKEQAPLRVDNLRGSETVLLVEDEDQVRTLARVVLRKYGYKVLEAKNAGEALLISESHPAGIDLLLSDVVMPQMSGIELSNRLGRSRGGLKVLCMSGYTGEAVVNHGLLDSGIPFLQKPFTPEGLARRVREVLDNPYLPPMMR